MNVNFESNNTVDAARALGVTQQTIANWCRNGFMRFQDVSEADSKRPRYLITDSEIDRVKGLIALHGTRKWMLYSRDELVNEIQAPEAIEYPDYDEEVTEETEKLADDDLDISIVERDMVQLKAAKRELKELLEEKEKLEEMIKDLQDDIIVRVTK